MRTRVQVERCFANSQNCYAVLLLADNTFGVPINSMCFEMLFFASRAHRR
jgi:hypothetical protein